MVEGLSPDQIERLLAIGAAQLDELCARAHTPRGASGDYDEAPAPTEAEHTGGTQ